jgi:hypothetical protein
MLTKVSSYAKCCVGLTQAEAYSGRDEGFLRLKQDFHHGLGRSLPV